MIWMIMDDPHSTFILCTLCFKWLNHQPVEAVNLREKHGKTAEIIEAYGGFGQKLTILALCGGRSNGSNGSNGADPCVACSRVEERHKSWSTIGVIWPTFKPKQVKLRDVSWIFMVYSSSSKIQDDPSAIEQFDAIWEFSRSISGRSWKTLMHFVGYLAIDVLFPFVGWLIEGFVTKRTLLYLAVIFIVLEFSPKIHQDAVRYFHDTLDLHADNATVQVEYFFLPCSCVETSPCGGPAGWVNVVGDYFDLSDLSNFLVPTGFTWVFPCLTRPYVLYMQSDTGV